MLICSPNLDWQMKIRVRRAQINGRSRGFFYLVSIITVGTVSSFLEQGLFAKEIFTITSTSLPRLTRDVFALSAESSHSAILAPAVSSINDLDPFPLLCKLHTPSSPPDDSESSAGLQSASSTAVSNHPFCFREASLVFVLSYAKEWRQL